jgi:hypothetical protein
MWETHAYGSTYNGACTQMHYYAGGAWHYTGYKCVGAGGGSTGYVIISGQKGGGKCWVNSNGYGYLQCSDYGSW